jgi:hypothetical protein
MMMRKIVQLAMVTCMLGLLSACGGGGGSNGGNEDSGPVVSSASFDLRASYKADFDNAQTENFTVSGIESGYSYAGSGSTSYAAAVNALFEGRGAKSQTSTTAFTISVNGVAIPATASETVYVDADYNPLGLRGSEYLVVTRLTPLPVAARVGDSGEWFSATRYADDSKTIFKGTATVNIALEADTASSAVLKITSVRQDSLGALESTTTQTYRITPSGSSTPLRDIAIDGSSSVVFTY